MGTLTGKTRYQLHTRFLRKPLIVLQVETTRTVSSYPYDDCDLYPLKEWRNATLIDLQELGALDAT